MFKINFITNKKILASFLAFLLIAEFFMMAKAAAAADVDGLIVKNLTAAEVAGSAFGVFDNNLQMTIWPTASSTLPIVDINNVSANLPVIEFKQINSPLPEPWQLDRVSPIYQFDFKTSLLARKEITLVYDKTLDSNSYKKVFYYNRNNDTWLPLSTVDNVEDGSATVKTTLDFATLAVFAYPEIPINGQASWYKYKNGDFAASPDFPKGSKIRVYNLDNGRSIDVTINDYGPNRLLYPNRVIDLDKVAFKKIASSNAGLINVRIEPLDILPDTHNRVLGIGPDGASAGAPTISAKSALVIAENSGEILYQKNPDLQLPLASLSKLAAIKTFLEIGDNRKQLSKIVKYSLKDEKMNYKYCAVGESARLKMKEGDKLSLLDLIASSLIGSTNNTVESLVRLSGLSRDNFIAKMNSNVSDWGATNTHFIEPTGLSPKNVSSVNDYAKIIKMAATDPIILSLSAKPTYTFKNIGGVKSKTITNTNKLIDLYRYPISISKTGYLNEAGYCLAERVKTGDDNIMVITFNNQTRTSSFKDNEELMRYGLSQVKKPTLSATSFSKSSQ